MRVDSLRYSLLTGAKRARRRLADGLRRTPVFTPVRAVYVSLAPIWRNQVVRAAVQAVRRPLYRADPRGYWQREGGARYMSDEAHILGPGSLTERQGAFLAAEVARRGGGRVLEVGCGYGRMLRELSARLDARLVGADFSQPQIESARQYLGTAPVPLVLADATRGLPFRDGSFDLVFTQGSLMHVPPPLDRAYRAELARVSRGHIVHTEEFRESESTFAHDNAAHYRELGLDTVTDEAYPLNLPGQTMRFQVFAVPGRSARS